MQTPLSPLGSPVPSPVRRGTAVTSQSSLNLSPSAAGASEMTPIPGDFPSVPSRVSDDAVDSSQWKKDPTWMALTALTLMQTGNVEQARGLFQEMCIISRVWPPPAGMPMYFGALDAAGIMSVEMYKTMRFYFSRFASYVHTGGDDPLAQLITGRRPDLEPPRAWYREGDEHDTVYVMNVINEWIDDRDWNEHPSKDMLPHVSLALELSREVTGSDADPSWVDTFYVATQHFVPPPEWTADDVQEFQHQWGALPPARVGMGKRPVPEGKQQVQSSPSRPARAPAWANGPPVSAVAATRPILPPRAVEAEGTRVAPRRATAQDAGPSNAPVTTSISEEEQEALRLASMPPPQWSEGHMVHMVDDVSALRRVAASLPNEAFKQHVVTIPYPSQMLRDFSGDNGARQRDMGHNQMRATVEHAQLLRTFAEWYRAAPYGDRNKYPPPTMWYHGTTARAALSLKNGITLLSPKLLPYQDFNGSIREDHPTITHKTREYNHGAFYLGDDFGQAASRAVSQLKQHVRTVRMHSGGLLTEPDALMLPVVLVYALRIVPANAPPPPPSAAGVVRATDMGSIPDPVWRQYVYYSRRPADQRYGVKAALDGLDRGQSQEDARMGCIAVGAFLQPETIQAMASICPQGTRAQQIAIKSHAAAARVSKALLGVVVLGVPADWSDVKWVPH